MRRAASPETVCSLALAGLCAFFIVCGWIGVDFGWHWDERFNVLQRAQYSLLHKTILPHWYEFPTLLHETTLAALVPDAIIEAVRGNRHITQTLIAEIDSRGFLFRMRMICCAATSLTAVWLFVLVMKLGRPNLEALAAAAIAASSWELHYHSRWLTADPVVTQFAALVLMLALLGHHRRSPRLLVAAAAAAGLACGTKYPAGALIVPILVACAMLPDRRMRTALTAIAAATIAFIITTPAIVIEPGVLISDLRTQIAIYSAPTDIYRSYFVSSPIDYAVKLIEYLGIVLPSHYPGISIVVALAAAIGLYTLARDDWRSAAIVVSFPLVYVGYFVTRHMMIVRNFLLLTPFIAFLAARGITATFTNLRTPAMRVAAVGGLAALAIINLAWLYVAAHSITIRDGRVFVREASAYIASHPETHFAISPAVRKALLATEGGAPRSWPLTSPDVDAVVFFAHEVAFNAIPANHWNTTAAWFGPDEVNFNYYPSWRANDRIVVVPRAHLAFR